ncbi:putative Zn-dependent protease with MMP-like domain [Arthrobacter oryzae]|uniref:metallopeptidase family protein n=1 Tax=Arthrobacter TaxID=1663 RepID=UPI001F192008|nr:MULTISPECIES: metallopeptidase family protein [Arthrobacter]MDP9986814.1 putative Zn-dependent protease with MMP-like domain [Arthrobacter oryzae]UKA72453.1 metallopeptidase family protein [Arthrobacter sp. FW306-06-A]
MQSSNHESGFSVRLADPDAPAATGVETAGRSFFRRRRNRHGRGLRGEVMLPTHPGYRTRGDRFDDMVLDSAQRLHDIWGKTLDGVRFGVDEIPPDLEQLAANAAPAPMGAYTPAAGEEGPTITVYRRVVEQACSSVEELQDLVHDVVVEHTAEMLGVAPETLDPVYRRRY